MQQMSPEEIRMLQAQIQAAGGGPQAAAGFKAGMVSPTVTAQTRADALREFKGEERAIDAQRDYANQLRGAGAPQGREVGPSNIYVGPNWGEQADYLGKQLMGGYLAGKANQSEKGLTKSREKTADAKAALLQDEADIAATAAAEKKAADLAEAKRKLAADEQNVTDEDARRAENERKNKEREKIDWAKVNKVSEAKGFNVPKTAEERKNFSKGGRAAAESVALERNWKPEYAIPKGLSLANLGMVETYFRRRLGEEEGTKAASWWSDKEKMELEPRHEMFGSAFTAPEQTAWNATTFSINDSPAFIETQLAKRSDVEMKISERIAAERLMENYDPALVELNFGDVVDIPALSAGLEDGSYLAGLRKRQTASRAGDTDEEVADVDLNALSLEELRAMAGEGG